VKIEILAPVKCGFCGSSRVVAVQQKKKIVGRYCEECKFYKCNKDGYKKVSKIKEDPYKSDYLNLRNFVFMVLKKKVLH
jgi:hypothetical protein